MVGILRSTDVDSIAKIHLNETGFVKLAAAPSSDPIIEVDPDANSESSSDEKEPQHQFSMQESFQCAVLFEQMLLQQTWADKDMIAMSMKVRQKALRTRTNFPVKHEHLLNEYEEGNNSEVEILNMGTYVEIILSISAASAPNTSISIHQAFQLNFSQSNWTLTRTELERMSGARACDAVCLTRPMMSDMSCEGVATIPSS